MKTKTLNCLLTIFFAAGTIHAQGVLMIQQETQNGKTYTSQVQMDKTHIRAESHAAGNTAVVFDGNAQVLRTLDLDRKTYVELDQTRLRQMRDQMAKMEEQMKNLPPQQRAMMEQMMRGRGGMMAAPPRPEYRQTGSDRVGSWTCTKYEGFVAQQKVVELCTVDPKALGLTAADFEVTKQLAEFVKSMMPQIVGQTTVYGTAEEQGFSGIPVRRTVYTNGQVSLVGEVKEIRHESFPPSTWEVPAGFRQEGMEGRP
jgi:hypothetical protein